MTMGTSSRRLARMKRNAWVALMLGLAINSVPAAETANEVEAGTSQESDVELDASPSEEGAGAAARQPSAELGKLCFFASKPAANVKYTVVKRLKVAKGTYGGVRDILPKFASYAQMHGADAIIDYTGSQRFGFWPWRMVRPVVRGTAIKWSGPPDQGCAALGGSTLETILATDMPPQ